MAATHDILQLKTEAELRFFIDNPSYYQPELVAAAQRELRRRGPSAASQATPATQATEPTASAEAAPRHLGAATAAASAYGPTTEQAHVDDYSYAEPRPAQRKWLLLASVAAVFFLAGLGFWFKSAGPSTAPAPAATAQAPTAKAPAPLETAVSAPLPYFDTDSYVDKALAQVPSTEKRNEQLLNQYRAVSTRFWAAQNPSAHLIQQVQTSKPNPVLAAQAQLVLGLWHDFDRTQVYSYSFGPVMADHLSRMKVIAQYQREALKELANDVEAQRSPYLDDDQTLAHQQALPHLLAALEHKTGPATVHL